MPNPLDRGSGHCASAELIAEVANLFDVLWERNSAEPPVAKESAADVRTAAIVVLEANVGKLAPAHGGIGHNRPDGDLPLAEHEQITVLRAISETRLAVLSGLVSEGPGPFGEKMQQPLADDLLETDRSTSKFPRLAGGPGFGPEI